jgi:hypothetical protein
MIELKTRLSYIGGISAFILNQNEIRSVWVNKKSGITSVTDFDELYEQLFDDLDMEELEREPSDLLSIDAPSRNRILNFLNSVRGVDEAIKSDRRLRDPSRLLISDSWRNLEVSCEKALEISAVQEAMRQEGRTP